MMPKIQTIVDHIGRIVIGEVVTEDTSTPTLNNPIILFVQPNPQSGQLNLSYMPYLFMEFLAPESKTQNSWTFQKSNIVVSDIQLDAKIIAQYKAFNVPQQAQEPQVIKLFED